MDAGPPVRVSYALTALGAQLEGVTRAIEDWGEALIAVRGEGDAGGVCAAEGEGCAVGEGE